MENGELASSGQIRPVIDRTYGLENIVDAHSYVDVGHKRGNVIISVR
jgi:NADPH:quinone reductase-like Zn-dependent oxidoreductase